MGDWDFLHDMRDEGYSAQEIADAAACGVAPEHWHYLNEDWLDDELDDELADDPFSLEPLLEGDERDFCIHEHALVFQDLIECAIRHYDNAGRYLQLWGELGEMYAEIKFGLRRHEVHAAGSDGTINGKLVEVKTISPEKGNDRVLVKARGNFEQLLIVRIRPDFRFQAKLVDRGELKVCGEKLLQGRFDG
jgi:hypothetical protein